MLGAFIEWGRALAGVRREGLAITLAIGSPTENPGARVDFDGSAQIGRITFWSDGSFAVEALEVATGGSVIMRHGEIAPDQTFDDAFRDILQWFEVTG